MTVADEPRSEARATLAAVVDEDRLAELARTGLMDGEREDAFDRLTRLATRVLGVPVSLVSLVDRDRQYFKSEVGLARQETPLSHSYCQYVVATGAPLVINDARLDPLVAANPAIRDLGAVAYAGIPLTTSRGHVLGSFCVIDNEARTWTKDDISLLTDLAALVTTEIEFRLKLRDLEDMTNAAERLATPVQGLTDHLGTLIRLIDGTHDPRFEHFAMLAQSRLRGIDRVMADLRAVKARPQEPEVTFAAADIARPVLRAVEAARVAGDGTGIQFVRPAEPLPATCNTWTLEQSITHLLIAAIHHSAGQADVRVELGRVGGMAQLEVWTPAVIPPGDLAKILSRFQSATCESPVGVGGSPVRFRTARGGVEAENGPLYVRSRRDRGTKFRLRLPLLDGDGALPSITRGIDIAGDRDETRRLAAVGSAI